MQTQQAPQSTDQGRRDIAWLAAAVTGVVAGLLALNLFAFADADVRNALVLAALILAGMAAALFSFIARPPARSPYDPWELP